jgi:hypothetical protein
MTPFRSLLTTLLLSLFITTNVIAASTPGDIVFPARIHANEAFKIIVSGFFSSGNSVTNHQITISGTNITIDVFAKNSGIILPMPSSWQVTANIPPLEEGDYSVAVVMHGNYEPTHLEQTENFSVLWCRPKITSLTFTPAQTTDQTPEINLTFTGNETSFYIVQSSTNLLDWTDEVIGLEPTDSTYSTSLPLIDSMRFYRIIEPLPDWLP